MLMYAKNYTVVLPFIHGFAFHGFSYLWSTAVQNIKWEI